MSTRHAGKPDTVNSTSPRKQRKPRSLGIMLLEPRVMYDAAAAATVADVHNNTTGDTNHTGMDAGSGDAANTPTSPAPATGTSNTANDGSHTSSSDASATDSTPTSNGQEIVIIDGNVPDLQTLLNGVKPGEQVFVLDPNKDGVKQIADIIHDNDLHDLSAIQIISHGGQGDVQLGSIVLNDTNIGDHADDLAKIGGALAPGGDIALYGCFVGGDAAGQQFITDLSNATGANVAASTDATGAAALGGNWTLEASTGPIEASVPLTDAALTAYPDLLTSDTFTVNQTTDLTGDPIANGGDGDGIADPGETVTTTVTIHNNSPDDNATGLSFSETLQGMTLVDQTGNDVNVSPIAFDDSYTAIGNTLLEVGNATSQIGPQKSVSGHVTDNDVEFFGDTFTISAFDAVTTNGGSVTMVTTGADMGSFTYISATGFTGTDTFTYTIRDKGLDGIAGNADDLTNTATVTITVSNRVWYVDGTNGSNASGTGTSTNPFLSITATNLNGGSDVDGTGDYIYLQNSVTGPLSLEANQHLIGTGVDLNVGGTLLKSATSNSGLSASSGTAVTLASNNEVAGITIINTGGGGIAGTNFGTATFNSVAINTSGQALDLHTGTVAGTGFNSVTSTGGTHNVTLDSVSGSLALGSGALSGATGAAFLVGDGAGTANHGGTVAITFSGTISKTSGSGAAVDIQDRAAGAGNITLSGNITHSLAGQTGVLLDDNAAGTITFSGATKTFNTGSAVGVSLTDNSGATISFTNGGLDIDTTSGTGFRATTGGTVNVSGTGNSIVSTSGTALDVSGVAANITFGQVHGGNAGNAGITLSTNTGSFTLADVVLATTSGAGLSASNSGTLVVTGATNTIATTTGTALNLTNTTIGAAGVTFKSIAASGAANGIVLNNTGASGGLTVTGDGGASSNGSGGTIQNSTGIGVSLTSTKNVSLGYMNITGSADAGIKGIGVNGFTLNHANVNNNGNSTSDEGIQFGEFSGSTVGVTGTVQILNSSVSGNAHNNVHIRNTSGTIANLTVTNSSFNNLNDTYGANSFLFEASGTSTVTEAFITGSTFSNNSPQRGLEVQAHDTATISDFVVSGNTFTDNGIHASFTQDGSSNLEFYFVNNGTAANPMTGSILQAVNVFSSSQSTGGTIVGTIQGNYIGKTGVSHSGSTQGGAISAVIQGQTDATLLIDSNTVRETNGDARAISVAFRGPANPLAGTLGANTVVSDVTITNNDIVPGSAPSGFPLATIVVEADNQSGSDAKAPTVRADIRNNTVPTSTVYDFFDAHIIYYEYDAAGGHGIGQLVNTTGAGTADAQLAATNTGTTASYGISLISGPINLPPSVPTPLLAQPGGVVPTAPSDAGATADTSTPADSGTADQSASGTQDQTDSNTSDQTSTTTPEQTSTDSTNVDNGILTQDELDAIVAAAIQRWEAAGLDAAQIAALQSMTYTVGDMSGQYLGSFQPGVITLDRDAAGRGWFIDSTPMDDAEFGSALSATLMQTDPTGAPAGHYDLLTTVMHEMGHELGLADHYDVAARSDVMYGYLYAGERRLPGQGEADGAAIGSIASEAFQGSVIQVLAADANYNDGSPVGAFTLPTGKTVTIQWQATIDQQTNQLIVNPSNTGTVTANGPFPASTNTNTVTTTLDTLTLGDRIFVDANNNQAYDTGEGVNGVTLTLYADNGTTPGQFDSGDTQIATTTTITSGGDDGFYSFTGLAPGDYIVRVDQTNFSGGNALNNGTAAIPLPGTQVDPDNNFDGDNSGATYGGAGGGVVSLPITLSYNNEPTAGAGNDTNNTLDFGFTYDQPPTVPIDNDGAANSVVEGAAANTLVNITAFSTDPDDPTVSYSLIGDTSGGGFQIDSGTGVVTVADGSKIDYESSAGHSYDITVQASDGRGGTSSQVFTINVTDVAPSTPTDSDNVNANSVVEGAANGTYTGLTASSTDVNGGTVTYSLTDDAGGRFAINSATGAVTVLDGTLIDFETATSHTITVQASDPSGMFTTQSFTINVTDVAPTATGENYSTDEDTALTVPAATGVLANDSDVNGGALTAVLDSGPAHAASFTLNADGSFSYTPTANYNGSDSFTYHASDGTLPSNITTVNLTVNAVNDAPVATTPAAHYSAIEQTAISLKNTGMSVSDVDDLGGGETVTLSVSEGTLTVTAGGSGAVVSGSGTSSVTINGTLSQINALLNTDGTSTVSYIDGLDNPSTSVTLTLAINDNGHTGAGGSLTGTSTATIDITPVNDAPVINNPSTSVAYTENGSPVPLSPTLTVSDVDSQNFSNATIVMTGGFSGDGDALSADTTGTAITASYNAATHTLTLTGNDTVANYQQVLRTVAYASTSDNPTNFGGTNPTRTVTWSVTDADAHPNPTPNDLTTIAANQTVVNITAVNDAPVVTAGNTLAYNANLAQPVVVDPIITVSDADNLNLTGATVKIASGFDGGRDKLAFTNQNGITGSYDVATGTLTLTGNASVAAYQTALASITFRSDSAVSGPRTISWQVNDGSASNNLSTPSSTTVRVEGSVIKHVPHEHHSPEGPGRNEGGPHHGHGPTPILDLIGGGHFNLDNTAAVYFVHANVTRGDITGSIGPDQGHLFSAQVPIIDLVAPLGGGTGYAIFAAQANGDPLPAWLHFDPATGIFSGEIPADAAGKLTLEVVARDAFGHESIMVFSVDLATGDIVGSAPTQRMFAHDPRGSAQHDRQAGADLQRVNGGKLIERLLAHRHTASVNVAPHDADDVDTPMTPRGRAGLSEQLKGFGWQAMHGERIALLGSVRQHAAGSL